MNIEYYLHDLMDQLLNEALELKSNVSGEFDRGRLFAYYEVIARMLNQAEAFGVIDKLPERVRNFNPESLLG